MTLDLLDFDSTLLFSLTPNPWHLVFLNFLSEKQKQKLGMEEKRTRGAKKWHCSGRAGGFPTHAMEVWGLKGLRRGCLLIPGLGLFRFNCHSIYPPLFRACCKMHTCEFVNMPVMIFVLVCIVRSMMM